MLPAGVCLGKALGKRQKADGASWLTLIRHLHRYTLVARKGSAPLYWGSDNGEGDSLLISTVPAYLSPFPPGCAFEVTSVASPCCLRYPGSRNGLLLPEEPRQE